jgi:transcriptional regulator with XRE-family HTH domain
MVRERPLHRKNGLLLATMIRQGYTLRSLAKAAGVHYLTIWRIVNREHRPNGTTAARIAELLQCPPERLGLQVWGPPPPTAPPSSDASAP